MTVARTDVERYLRLGGRPPDAALADRIDALIARAARVIRPARTWRRFPLRDGAVRSGGLAISIRGTLARHIAGCRDVLLVCGTLGAGFDALHRRAAAVSGADAFILQAVGAAAIEDLMDAAERDAARADLVPGETLRPRYSPGYGDFPLAVQPALLALLDTSRRIGVSVTDTLLMVPSKSVSAVIGILPPP